MDVLDLAGVHARDAHLRAVVKRGDLGELGVDLEGLGKQHASVADQEQADGEEEQPSQHEGADARRDGCIMTSARMRGPHECANQLVVALLQLRGGAAGDDPPVVQHDELVAEPLGAGDVVRDDDERRAAVLLQAEQQLVDLVRVIGSRPALGSSTRRMGGSSAMARASPARFRMPPDRSPGIRSYSFSSPTASSFARARWRIFGVGERRVAPQRERDVLADRDGVEERRALKQKADLAPNRRQRPTLQRADLLVLDEHASGVGTQQPDDVPQRDALARAAATENDERRSSPAPRASRRSVPCGEPKLLVTPSSRTAAFIQ